ncbi:zinc finger protein 728-like [Culicoides brevitarsis]|uniref:zinc finger protein 728-like n=1 Tax=Culicoides brevitarsis TaxID=469753 RepID=UPI00307C4F7A
MGEVWISETIYCRLCLNEDQNSTNFIEVNDKSYKINEKIQKLFNFVWDEVEFSTFICIECCQKITDIVDYVQKVERNQEKLKRKHIKKEDVKSETYNDEEDIEFVAESADYFPEVKFEDHESDEKKVPVAKKLKKSPLEDYLCDICSKSFSKKTYLVRHMQKHLAGDAAKDKNFDCELCSRSFPTLTGLSVHKAQGHEVSVDISEYLFCELCPKTPTFGTFNDMHEHYMAVHHVRGYARCCTKKFLTKRSVVYHAQVHSRPMDFLCPVCKKMFPNKYSLTNHMARHKPEEEKQFECEICGKRFALEYDKKVHLKNVHERDSEVEKATCTECNKTFASKLSLYLHNRRFHMNLALPMCETCGKQCRSKADLRSHIRSRHTDIPKTKCDICGNMVKNMKKHLQIHEESKLNIKCDICDHKTTTFKYLKLHMKIHNDEKPYVCSTCGLSFKRKKALNDHMSLHSGIPRHFCNYCDRTFNNSGNKFKHIKQAHPVEAEKNRRNRGLKAIGQQPTNTSEVELTEPIIIAYEVNLDSTQTS